jgi:hypothetical protein
MKKIIPLILLITSVIFAQSDSLKNEIVVNTIIKESNQFRVLVYLYRFNHGRSPVDSSEFFDYLDDESYPHNFKFINNIKFYDTNKVSYDFNLLKSDSMKINDSTEIDFVKANVIADYSIGYSSTIHSMDIKIDSAILMIKENIFVITKKHETGIFIRLDKKDLLSIKSNITNKYKPNTPEYLVIKALQCTQNQDWESYAEILYPEDLAEVKKSFDYIIQSKKGDELLQNFKGISSKKEFLKLTPKKFFPEFMKFILSMEPKYAYAFKNITIQIIGSVKEKNMVHVLSRQKINLMGKSLQQLEVDTTIKIGNKYYLKLEDNMKQSLERIRSFADKN